MCTLVSSGGPSEQSIRNILPTNMLHNWNGLLLRCWIGFVNVDSEVNRLVLVTSFALYHLHLVLDAQDRAASVALGIARGVHGCILRI